MSGVSRGQGGGAKQPAAPGSCGAGRRGRAGVRDGRTCVCGPPSYQGPSTSNGGVPRPQGSAAPREA